MTIETEEDLRALRRVGQVVALALRAMQEQVEPGITTLDLDRIGEAVLTEHGGRSAPRLVYDFPGCNCISLNDEAVHGIPGDRAVQAGDLVKLDVTAELDGYMADAAVTVTVPEASAGGKKLARTAHDAFWQAARVARAGREINVIGRAIESEARRRGLRVLRELNSHGVGRTIHESPTIPQYEVARPLGRLREGQVVTIEPILAAGTSWTRSGSDPWTLRTADGSLSAHYEHTVVITRRMPIILTALN